MYASKRFTMKGKRPDVVFAPSPLQLDTVEVTLTLPINLYLDRHLFFTS